MKTKGMKASLYYPLWALAGAAVLLVLVVFVFRFQPQSVSAQLAATARLQDLISEMRLDLASAVEDEKSAVLSTTDSDSATFADKARAETAAVDGLKAQVALLLTTKKERDLLGQFQTAFSEFQRVDEDLLGLAVKNTNLKAYALAFGPAANAIDDMDAALSRLVTQKAGSDASTARQAVVFAAGADAGALRIEALLAPHIAEQSDVKMDELEARMAKEDKAVQVDLRELETLLPANPDVGTARSRYGSFRQIQSQILELSRENTNVKSLAISLSDKRKVTVLCQDALSALEGAIEGEHVPGGDVALPR